MWPVWQKRLQINRHTASVMQHHQSFTQECFITFDLIMMKTAYHLFKVQRLLFLSVSLTLLALWDYGRMHSSINCMFFLFFLRRLVSGKTLEEKSDCLSVWTTALSPPTRPYPGLYPARRRITSDLPDLKYLLLDTDHWMLWKFPALNNFAAFGCSAHSCRLTLAPHAVPLL